MKRCFIIHYDQNVIPLAHHLLKQINEIYPNDDVLLQRHNPSSDLSEISWRKVEYLVKNFDRFDFDKWYITIDCDCTILDKDKNIDSFLDCGKNFLFGSDWNGLCAATIAIKKSYDFEQIKSLLNTWYCLGNTYNIYEKDLQKGIAKRYEQNSIKWLKDIFPSVNYLIGILSEDFMTDNPKSSNLTSKAPLFWHYGAANSVDKKLWILDNLIKSDKPI